MNFACQILKGEFNFIIPLSYIFGGIGFAAIIYTISRITHLMKNP